MSLVVYCNGYLGYKGEYVSIEPRILSGKFDEKLEWPLHCKIEIEIQSVHNEPNLKKIIKVNSLSPTPRDRFVSQSLGTSGCQHIVYVRLGSVLGYQPLSSYLKDGYLTIDVIKVTFYG